jgi:hypothetical protein
MKKNAALFPSAIGFIAQLIVTTHEVRLKLFKLKWSEKHDCELWLQYLTCRA